MLYCLQYFTFSCSTLSSTLVFCDIRFVLSVVGISVALNMFLWLKTNIQKHDFCLFPRNTCVLPCLTQHFIMKFEYVGKLELCGEYLWTSDLDSTVDISLCLIIIYLSASITFQINCEHLYIFPKNFKMCKYYLKLGFSLM